MKQIFVLLIMLFVSFPGYGDKYDDQYQSILDHIQRGLDLSPETGYDTASEYASECFNYVLGFVHGNMANGNYQERESKKYADWDKSWRELLDKQKHFISLGDYGNASYYAKKESELNCQYETTLRRELFK